MSIFSKVYEEKMAGIVHQEEINEKFTEFLIRQIFYTSVIASFEWGGKDFPEFIKQTPDFVEESLFSSGKIGGFESKSLNQFVIAPVFGSGKLLENGLYDKYTAIFRNGVQEIIDIENIELCFNNFAQLPSRIIVEEFIQKCNRALRTVDISLIRAGLPSIISIDDESKVDALVSAMEASYKQNKPFHIFNGSWAEYGLSVPQIYDDKSTNILGQWDIFVRYKNLFYTTFGLNNVEIAKTERLTQAESTANTEITRYSLFDDMWKHRKDFVKRVKEHFGKEITCELNRNYDTVTALNLTTEEKIKMQESVIAPYKDNVTEPTKEDIVKTEKEIGDD